MSSFEPYVDPFAAYVETPAAGGGAAKASNYNKWKLVKLQRWNTVLRVMTFVFTLAAIMSTLFAKESYNGWEAEYKYFTSFQFVLYTNGVVCLYALVISVLAIIMGFSSTGLIPASVMTISIVLNSILCVSLLMAFSAGTATEIISRNGWQFTDAGYILDSWSLCDNYSGFCTVIEIGLGFTGLAFLSLAASTGIDVYYKSQVTG